LTEERRLRAFENCLLRRIFGPKRDEVTGEWRKLRDEELNDLNSSPNTIVVIKSRRMRWAAHVARMGERTGVYRVLVGTPERKRPLGKPRRRWEDNIKWIFRKWDVRVWTGSSWLRIRTGGGHL
jgi:DNA transposition AAA+ family ATPase